MRHVIAGCGFLLVLYLPFWWWAPPAQPGEDALALVLVLMGLALYSVLAILALIMYYALFYANMLSVGLLTALLAAIAICWKLHWIAGIEALEGGTVAAAILAHHSILRAISPAK